MSLSLLLVPLQPLAGWPPQHQTQNASDGELAATDSRLPPCRSTSRSIVSLASPQYTNDILRPIVKISICSATVSGVIHLDWGYPGGCRPSPKLARDSRSLLHFVLLQAPADEDLRKLGDKHNTAKK